MREVRIRLAAADVSRMRWAISPAWELLASLRVLGRPGEHAVHMPWLSRHRGDPLLTDPRHRAVRDFVISAPGHLPGFLAPTPESPLTTIDDELDAVAATPAEIVRREVSGSRPAGVPQSLTPLLKEPRREIAALVADLGAYWRRAIEPHWPQMRSVLERDVQHRASALAEDGPGEMLNSLHPDLVWHDEDDTLLIRNRLAEITDPERTLAGRGLVLVPSVFAWPRVYAKTVEPWTPVVRYPARGVGALWESDPAPHDLTAVLGKTRARLLALLETPSTTHQLARSLHAAPGGISAHLHRLVTAGLASKARVGREVYYARTVRGDHLIS
ncbi:DUF5937 family protein [Nonomuraea sp. NPDC049714]|uniref:DUF5937 family protein n=1 Tax=Nonomuraea sp. NPDC049714 TaxID=3364357 RepID=UPI0037A8524F